MGVVGESGKVYAFGSNHFGQLGLPGKAVVAKPASVKTLKGRKIAHVACGRSHTLVALRTLPPAPIPLDG